MKVSISLPEADVAFLDEYAALSPARSRSAVVHRAIELLRESQMEDAYANAWQEWHGDEDAQLWENTVADGLSHV